MNGFPKNSRVCFLGDSITYNNGYVSHISAFYHKHFKERNVNFYNCGIAGGRVETLLDNFDDDIMVHNPTHAVIMIGVNNSSSSLLFEPRSRERYEKLLAAFEIFKKNLSVLCDKLKYNNVEIILCTQTPYDEYMQSDVKRPPASFALMMGYAEYVREYARINHFGLCDYQRYIIEKNQEEELFNPDGVHPNDLGQYYMAKCFLAYQGLELGEMEQFPEYMARWRELVEIERRIRTAEFLLAHSYNLTNKKLSDEEKWKLAERYLFDTLKEKQDEYLVSLSETYLQNKKNQNEIKKEINTLMEKNFKE